jgi:hypothetical protein
MTDFQFALMPPKVFRVARFLLWSYSPFIAIFQNPISPDFLLPISASCYYYLLPWHSCYLSQCDLRSYIRIANQSSVHGTNKRELFAAAVIISLHRVARVSFCRLL